MRSMREECRTIEKETVWALVVTTCNEALGSAVITYLKEKNEGIRLQIFVEFCEHLLHLV